MRQLLEEFDGFLDKIEGDVVHVTLISCATGESFWGEHPVKVMEENGIRVKKDLSCDYGKNRLAQNPNF